MPALTWITKTVHEAKAPTGGVYRVVENSLLARGKKYVALYAFEDSRGRLFEHVVGRFDTVTAAKTACEADAKEA